MAESADILDAMYSYPGRPPIPAPTPAPTVPPPLIPVPTIIGIIGIIFLLLHGVLLFFRVCSFQRLRETSVLTDVMRNATSLATDVMRNATVERFLREMAKEKPIRFTPDQHKIVHYDIKPGNVLLDGALTPKVADFGLARLVNRADTHVSLSCGRGTPGYAAPEVWMELRITEKCDVYSFGMLLLKIVRRGSCFNAQDAASGSESSQPWFPMVAWTRYEAGGLMELVLQTDMDDSRSRELVERMCKVAFWCVQQRPPARPSMSVVVKMLEGEMEIRPPPNPFQYLMESSAANLRRAMASTVNTSNEIISF